MAKIDLLQQKIECTRKQMYDTYEHDPQDPKILVISRKLDGLLNELGRSTNANNK
ncbi:aspartyl-phosphate phosphatase Spo0E family protein [Virgibacillus sp. 179-BFC.A HS]|uniref:Aspartyl-phosphate phosphatase Spo0E family protein n=1 Tax=Tigheibacillus jepli TaxID=3035914 RepID=A0ABU5CG42_9BACI|nr:aspartyl-phosphate phosphatase Spo0E family protein [Virgibacillus sp. 179-BFC.A HS]MDY0405288.1 aspartyl-phosphate phosphatase Spo0E family protein [Virgibacillus sp. 179-BFC.A HS]